MSFSIYIYIYYIYIIIYIFYIYIYIHIYIYRGGGWASITGGLVGQRTAPPLVLLLLSFNNCFSMSNFVLATKRYLI